MSLPNLAALTIDVKTVHQPKRIVKKVPRDGSRPVPVVVPTMRRRPTAFERALEVAKDRVLQQPRRGVRLEIDDMPVEINDEDVFYIRQLDDNEVVDTICGGEITPNYVRERLGNVRNLLWLIRSKNADTGVKYSGTVFGFAIASTRRRFIPPTPDIRDLENVLVLHLDVICAMRGKGMELFQNVLRFAFITTEYRYVELEALNTTLADMYRKTSLKVFGRDIMAPGLPGIPQETYNRLNTEGLVPLHIDLSIVR